MSVKVEIYPQGDRLIASEWNGLFILHYKVDIYQPSHKFNAVYNLFYITPT